MKKAHEYQEHAEQCRALAKNAANQEQRQMLVNMAETWESLARDREIRIARQQRIKSLEIERSEPEG